MYIGYNILNIRWNSQWRT